MVIAGVIAVTVATGAWIVPFFVALPLLLAAGTIYLGLSGNATSARYACLAFFVVGANSYVYLLPGASMEIFLASNFPAIYLWFPERLARQRRMALALCFVSYLFACAFGERWGLQILSEEQIAAVRVVVLVIFPLDLLGTISALFRANLVQQSALRDARDLALTADRLKTRILNSVAHELRSPLAASLGLLVEVPGDTARDVTRSVQAVLRRTTDLLDLARFESGRVARPRVSHMNPGQVLNRILVSEVGSFHVELSPTAKGAFELDGAAFKRAAHHLVDNVRRHGGDRALARLRFESGSLILDIQDEGPGLDPERRRHLFQPFDGGAGSLDDGSVGQSIGLALSRNFARSAGGELEVLEDHPAGFAVQLRLPATRSAEAPREPAIPPLGLKVLVVEDDALNRKIVHRQLKRLGCTTTLVKDGLEAVEAVARTRFDVVLMDVRMPRMDGLTATRVIKETEEAPPIFALTANALAGDRDRCLDAGMDAFLSKPFKPETFLRLLGERSLRRSP